MEAEAVYENVRWGIAGDAKDAEEIESLLQAMEEGWKIGLDADLENKAGSFLTTPALRYRSEMRKKDDEIKALWDQTQEAARNETLSAKLDNLDLSEVERSLIEHQEKFFKGLMIVPKERDRCGEQ
jgi:hypothetical protein